MESCNNMEEIINLMMEPAVPVLDLDHMDHLHRHGLFTTGQNPSLHLPFTATASSSSSSRRQIISFSNPADVSVVGDGENRRKPVGFQCPNLSFLEDEVEGGEDDHGYNCKQPRSPKQAQFHALAERNRRNKLREYFISLSRVVPGIRKLDKSTILEDATNHIKELEERITMLEKGTKESLVGSRSRNPKCDVAVEGEMPEIKVIIFEENVLIKILCDKKYQSSVLLMLDELKKLHLIICSTNVLQFGDSAIDITFGTQMETQFSATVEDIRNHLRDEIFQVKS